MVEHFAFFFFTLIAFLSSSFVGANGSEANATFVPQNKYPKPHFGIRVVGGEPAANHQFPWQASITSCSQQSCSICGGSLIANNFVLTAAHCTDGVSQFEIGLGSTSLYQPVFRVQASNKIQHPNFNKRYLLNDIALIKLSQPILLSDSIRTVKLAGSSSGDFAGNKAFASGFGVTTGNLSFTMT